MAVWQVKLYLGIEAETREEALEAAEVLADGASDAADNLDDDVDFVYCAIDALDKIEIDEAATQESEK